MKKVFLLVVILALVVGVLPGSLAADSEPTFVLSGEDEIYTTGNDEYVLAVQIENNPGIVSLRFDISWDSNNFDLVYMKNLSLFQGIEFTPPQSWKRISGKQEGPFELASVQNPSTFYFKGFTAPENYYENGTIIILTFKLKEGATLGTSNFKVELSGDSASLTFDMQRVQWTSATKSVTIASCTHDWEDATCTEPQTCSICGETQGNTAPHTWVAATCTAPKTCSVCAVTEGEANGHSWNPATCILPKTCSVCSVTEGEAKGHSWIEATCLAPKTCSVCAVTEGEKSNSHNFVLGVCADCGYYNYGDVNGDGTVDDLDDMLLTRYLALWPDINIIEGTSDVNGDGEIDDSDNAILSRYLANWSGYVLGPSE